MVANASTGYNWKWINSQTVQIFDSIDYNYIIDNPEMSGEIWTFKGVKKGSDSLIMEYGQSWDRNSTIDSKTIVVKVE